jgi:hypothetical protein
MPQSWEPQTTGGLSGVLQVNGKTMPAQGKLTFVGFYIPQGRRLV